VDEKGNGEAEDGQFTDATQIGEVLERVKHDSRGQIAESCAWSWAQARDWRRRIRRPWSAG
jgi:hypothetical protein